MGERWEEGLLWRCCLDNEVSRGLEGLSRDRKEGDSEEEREVDKRKKECQGTLVGGRDQERGTETK